MRLDIILADAAQAVGGKAYLLGAGWSMTGGEGPTSMAVVIFLEVPWDQTGRKIPFRLELLDADGQPVDAPGPAGPQHLIVDGEVEAGRPADLPHGTPVALQPLTITIGSLPLDPGRYVWKVSLDGESREEWQRGFTKVAAIPGGLP